MRRSSRATLPRVIGSAAAAVTIACYAPFRVTGALTAGKVAGLWAVCVVFAMMWAVPTVLGSMAWNVIRMRRPFADQPAGAECCKRCGYPRQGLECDRCPECGESGTILNLPRAPVEPGRWLAAVGVGIGCGALLTEALLLLR